MRGIVVGAVESSRVAIEAIGAADGWELRLVVSLPPDLARRHSDFVDLAPAAAAAGARLLTAANVNDEAVLAAIREAGADYIFVIGWSQICGPEFRALLPDRVIGYHPAALPRLRGRAVIPWTILADEPITAGTLFWIDSGVDSGAILEQRFFHLAPQETATTLYARHMAILRTMMDGALTQLASGAPPRLVQDEACATWAARRIAADGYIDWSLPAATIARLIRAVTRPYPGAMTQAGTSLLTIWSARIEPGPTRHLAGPGQVVDCGDREFTVLCGDGGLLTVTDWTSSDNAMPGRHSRLALPECTRSAPATPVPQSVRSIPEQVGGPGIARLERACRA